MQFSPTRRVIAAAVIVVALAACSSDSSTAQKDSTKSSSSSSSSPSSGSSAAGATASVSPELCSAFQALSDASNSAGTLDVSNWTSAQQQIAGLTPKLDSAWDQAIGQLSGDLKNDAQRVKAFTDKTFALAAQVSSATDWSAAIQADSDALPAGQAAQRVDQFSITNCGVNPAGSPAGGSGSSGN